MVIIILQEASSRLVKIEPVIITDKLDKDKN